MDITATLPNYLHRIVSSKCSVLGALRDQVPVLHGHLQEAGDGVPGGRAAPRIPTDTHGHSCPLLQITARASIGTQLRQVQRSSACSWGRDKFNVSPSKRGPSAQQLPDDSCRSNDSTPTTDHGQTAQCGTRNHSGHTNLLQTIRKLQNQAHTC